MPRATSPTGAPREHQRVDPEPLLKGALKTPMYEWPKSRKAAKALRKGNLGDAIKASAKIEEDHPDIVAAVVGMADGRSPTWRRPRRRATG